MIESRLEQPIAKMIREAFPDQIQIWEDFDFTLDNGLKRRADIVFIHNELGIFVIEVKKYSNSRLSRISRPYWTADDWPNSIAGPYDQALFHLPAIEEKLTRISDSDIAAKQKRILVAMPGIQRRDWIRIKSQVPSSLESRILFSDDLNSVEDLKAKLLRAPVADAPVLPRRVSPPDYRYDIFISYRRADAIWAAGRLSDFLRRQMPSKRIFLDTQSIRPGKKFREDIEQQIQGSSIVLAVIGPNWLKASHALSGVRRLDDPDDFVRLELGLALQSSLRDIVPILIDGTKMPDRAFLPEPIQALCDHNAFELTAEHFEREAAELAKHLSDILEP